eukprot:766786-Hanusia_phi.AAC.3
MGGSEGEEVEEEERAGGALREPVCQRGAIFLRSCESGNQGTGAGMQGRATIWIKRNSTRMRREEEKEKRREMRDKEREKGRGGEQTTERRERREEASKQEKEKFLAMYDEWYSKRINKFAAGRSQNLNGTYSTPIPPTPSPAPLLPPPLLPIFATFNPHPHTAVLEPVLHSRRDVRKEGGGRRERSEKRGGEKLRQKKEGRRKSEGERRKEVRNK